MDEGTKTGGSAPQLPSSGTAADKWAQKRQEVLSSSPTQALDRLLANPDAAALVQSFSEQDLYYLIQGIGPEDALPLLTMASEEQWEYILDTDIWEKDRIDPAVVTQWLELMYRADAGRCVRWLLKEKTEFLEYYLFDVIDVRIREHDQDPSEFGDDYFSLDNLYYIKVKEPEADAEQSVSDLSDHHNKRRRDFIHRFLRSMAAMDYAAFQNVVAEAMGVIPAETEEEEYRLRSVRLAEKGLLPFEEAVGIYQPLQVQDLAVRDRSAAARQRPSTAGPGPYYPLMLVESDSPFNQALNRIDQEELGMAVQTEFAALCNNLIVADRQKIRERSDLANIVRKASGYISIGLQRLIRKDPAEDHQPQLSPSVLIGRHPLSDLFKMGYEQAMALKWRAEKWLKDCWFARQGLPLTFWGEEWLGVLGGLLIKRPLYFDHFRSGTLYRDFESLADIETTEANLNAVISFDKLLSTLSISLTPMPDVEPLTYKNLLLTLWARHRSGLDEQIRPIALTVFKSFYHGLWQGGARRLKIAPEAKADFLKWLSSRSGVDRHRLSKRYAAYLEALFDEVEDDFGDVASKDLDPKYIQLFWVTNG